MHLSAVHVDLLQRVVYHFHFLLLAGEYYDALQVAVLEDVFYDAHLLVFIAYVCALLYLLRRFAHGDFHLHRIF